MECSVCKLTFYLQKGELLKYRVNPKGITEIFCSTECQISKRHSHKYKATRCESDSIKFGSKAERGYYFRLQALKKYGEVVFFLSQVPLDLPGNTKYFVIGRASCRERVCS